ncbi:MAG TPA: hypothetical protein VFQ61_21070 [Polyangiaceae bacterium]|nr:hypothetical protein [Polyangiaceae bacterium]
MQNAASDLATRLEQNIGPLSRRCTEAMYGDPFWSARFGARGRAHAEADSGYHVKYVAAALRADDVTVFKKYALWLRGVLVSRNMCSWHLAESFRQLTLAMRAEHLEGVDRAAEVMHEGALALGYQAGDAGELTAHLANIERQAQPESCYRIAELLSFLADGLAHSDDRTFACHVTFLNDTLARDASEHRALLDTLRTLREAALNLLSATAGSRVAKLIDSCGLLEVPPPPTSNDAFAL